MNSVDSDLFVLYSVMKADSPDDMDRLSFQQPLSKEMGDQIHIEMTPLRSYEGFATDLNKKLTGDETTFEDLPTVPKAGLFYWITFYVEYPGTIGARTEILVYFDQSYSNI